MNTDSFARTAPMVRISLVFGEAIPQPEGGHQDGVTLGARRGAALLASSPSFLLSCSGEFLDGMDRDLVGSERVVVFGRLSMLRGGDLAVLAFVG